MFDTKTLALAGLAMTAVLLSADQAAADEIRLTNGRTIKVDHVRFEGDVVILQMPGGEEVHTPRALVESVAPEDAASARATALRALAASPTAAAPPLTTSAIRALVDRVAHRVGLDARLAHAIVRAESNYEPLAVSARGAMGLMQIMPALAGSYAVRDPYNPEQNLEAGMRHLLDLVERFGAAGAIAAYNAGVGAVIRAGGVPPFPETQSYVRRIMASMP